MSKAVRARSDHRQDRNTYAHCRSCGKEFTVSRRFTSEFTCCGVRHLVAVIYGHIYVDLEDDADLTFIREVNRIKRMMK